MYTIVTEAAADLPAELVRKSRIIVIPLTYCVDGKEITARSDGSYNDRAFYELLRSKANVTTSLISPERYRRTFESVLETGNDILFIGMSSATSGSFRSAQLAVSMLEDDYPERKIALVDSLGATLGVGLLVLYAVSCRERGMELEEAAHLLERRRMMLYQIVTVNDLFYLQRTGRLSVAKAAVGSALHIMPLIKEDTEGRLVFADKARGRKNALQTLANKLFTLGVDIEKQTVGIAHTDCAEDAKALERIILERVKPRHLVTACVNPALGTHVGPGMVGIFFFGDENVRNF